MSESGDSGPGTREVAYRLFAAEFDDAALSYSESDEERAPNYVVTPTGLRANRLFAVGVLTEVESVNDDVLRGRVADPTGAFVTYAGQYQPEALSYLDRTDPPAFVALTGKARTFEPDDGDRVFTSVRPEAINAVDAGTRDRWVVSAARATLNRLGYVADALEMDERGDDLRAALLAADVPESLAAGIPRAIEFYGTTPAYLADVRRMAVDALELIAGEREEVRTPERAPGEGGPADLGPLPTGVDRAAAAAATTGVAETEADAATDAATETDTAAGTDTDATTADEGSAAAPDEPASAGETPAEPDETAADPTEAAAESTETAAEPTEAAATPSASTPAATDSDATADEESSEGASADVDAGGSDDLGDFDSGGDLDADAGEDLDADAGEDLDADAGEDLDADAEPPQTDEMYELDEEERREVEEEFGTEFASGNEVDAPGEADIDVPEAEPDDGADAADAPAADASETAAADGPTETASTAEAATGADEETTPEEAAVDDGAADDGAPAEGAAADVDLESVAVDAMDALDDGDGADREAVVARVVDEYGADPADVEDAIQSALMSGRCYEPGEDRLKAI